MAAEDWISGEWPPEEDGDYYAEGWTARPGRRTVTCKHCGKKGLHWENENGRWVLVERNYEAHTCWAHKASLEDFDALD